jgi:nucleotidyltransferase/DNA polymerase involved in DNA repair
MYNAPLWKLKLAFGGIVGYYWYLRLRGWEIDSASFDRKSYGHSYSLPKPLKTKQEVSPILTKLVQKTGTRLRRSGYKTQGVSLLLTFQDKTYFHRGCKLSQPVFDSGDIYAIAERLLAEGTEKEKTIRLIAVTCFNLQKDTPLQLNLYQNVVRKEALTKTVDTINGRFGNFTVAPARMVLEKGKVLDRIAFGAVKEL